MIIRTWCGSRVDVSWWQLRLWWRIALGHLRALPDRLRGRLVRCANCGDVVGRDFARRADPGWQCRACADPGWKFHDT